MTGHRSQGATVRRAQSLEDGGGRELAYVTMSRAWESTTLHTVADSLEQAVEDLTRAWSHSRRIGWAIVEASPPRTSRHGAPDRSSRKSRSACVTPAWWPNARSRPPPFRPTLDRVPPAATRLQRLKDEKDALIHADGTGVLRGTP